MKTLVLLVVTALLIGCSNPVTQYVYPCVTVGIDTQIEVAPEADGFRVLNVNAILTSCDVYFYIPDGVPHPTADAVQQIPDNCIAMGSKYTGSRMYTGLSVRFSRDVRGAWFSQILHNGSKLCGSIGEEVTIQNFILNVK